jgi:hypothetical protein
VVNVLFTSALTVRDAQSRERQVLLRARRFNSFLTTARRMHCILRQLPDPM